MSDSNRGGRANGAKSDDQIVDEEFEALLDQLAEPRGAQASTPETANPSVAVEPSADSKGESSTQTTPADDRPITEEEFEALLDRLDEQRAAQTSTSEAATPSVAGEPSGSKGEPTTETMPADDGLITEEEFEAILERRDALARRQVANTEPCGVAGGMVIELGRHASIAQVANLRARLARWSPAKGTVSVDAGEVERIDTAALQLLYAFKRHVEAQGASMRWAGASPALVLTAQTLGLTSYLELSAAGPVVS